MAGRPHLREPSRAVDTSFDRSATPPSPLRIGSPSPYRGRVDREGLPERRPVSGRRRGSPLVRYRPTRRDRRENCDANRRAPPQDIPEEGAPEGGPNGGDGLRIRDRGTDNPLEIVDSARGERPIRPPSPSPLLVDDLPDWAFRFIRPAINRLLLDRPDPLLHRPNRLQ